MKRLLTLALAVGANCTWAASVNFEIDASRDRMPVSPYIYGKNIAGNQNAPLGVKSSLVRIGGNRWTSYNWENNASNAGTDWFNQNDGWLGGGEVPGEAVAARIANAHGNGAAALVTVPMVDYLAKDKLANGDVAGTPDYLNQRFVRNAPRKNGTFANPPNTADGYVYQDEFVHWLYSRFPYAATDASRPIFFSLDNEPDLWMHTHPRIHPSATTYAELFNRTLQFASAIKAVAPNAVVFGPVNYGFNGYVSLQNAPDAGGRDFLETYLARMKEYETQHGKRLVDVLDVHWYPEARDSQNRRIISDASDGDMRQARVQAPRSLWDATYRENSWIANDYLNGPITLIPRLKQKIATHYPGTRLAFTEYYYGGGNDISGAIAQADVLGTFAREGIFAANLWHLGATEDRFIDAGFKVFTNFDGAGSGFGDTAVRAVTNDVAKTAVYAGLSTGTGRLTLVAINRSDEVVTANVQLAGGNWLYMNQWELGAASPGLVLRGSAVPVANNTFGYTLPPKSVTVFALSGTANPPGPGPTPEPGVACNEPWDARWVYLASQRVSKGGTNYRARWYTQGNDPVALGPWEALEACSVPAPAPACNPLWDAGRVYVAGQPVTHGGLNYEAKWWVQGTVPSAADVYGPWKLLGSCNAK